MHNIKRILLSFSLFIFCGALYSAECEKPNNEVIGHWGELERLSHELGFILCVEVKGKSKGYTSSQQKVETIFEIWKVQVRKSAIEMDEVLIRDDARKFQELTIAFIDDVELALIPMFGVTNRNQQNEISQSISLPSIRTKEGGDPQNIGLLKVNVWTKGQSIKSRFEVSGVNKAELANLCKEKFTEARANYCISYAKAWSKAVSAYSSQVSKISPAQISLAAVKYSNDWGNFYSVSRSQTFLDTIYTSYRYRDKLSGSAFVKAPDIQYFLFRPGIVMEYMGAAIEGNRFKEALSFELYGFNYWRKCPVIFDNACGMSLVTTFSDRVGGNNINSGLMFHYNNNLSLGIVHGWNTDKDIGIFVTIDLLKAVESKNKQISAWRKTVKDNLSDFSAD